MVLLREDVEIEDTGVGKIVTDQKPVLLAFKPAILAREFDRLRLRAYLVINMVNISHIPLQLYRLLSDQLKSGISG